MTTINLLPCPEIALYEWTEASEGVFHISYATRPAGETMWGAFATIRTTAGVVRDLSLPAEFSTPQEAVNTVRELISIAPSAPHTLNTGSLRIIEGGRA